MPVTYPTHGLSPWDTALKAYLDARETAVIAASVGQVATDLDDPSSSTGAVLFALLHPLLGVTPEEYGAVGDNVADDHTALANAFADAVSKGVPLLIKHGKTYRSASQLNPLDNLNMYLGGRIESDHNGVAWKNAVDGTKVNNIRVWGPGSLGRRINSQTGVIWQVYGDRQIIDDITIDKWGGGVAMLPAGDFLRYNKIRLTNTYSEARGRIIYDAVFNSTTTMTSATANFTSADVGMTVEMNTGNTPINSAVTKPTIVSVTNSTTVVMSAAAVATASNQTVLIASGVGDGGFRYCGGRGSRFYGLRGTAGDDFIQAVPLAGTSGMAMLDITDCVYTNCYGKSTFARIAAVANVDTNGTGAMTCNIRGVTFRDCGGEAGDRAFVVQSSTASGGTNTGVVEGIRFIGCRADMQYANATHTEDIQVTSSTGGYLIKNVSFEGVTIINSKATSRVVTVQGANCSNIQFDKVDLGASYRQVTDGAINSNTNLTSATAAFTQADVGQAIAGTNIPANTLIAAVTNSTTVVLSQAATATTTGVTLTIGSAASVFLVNAATGFRCRNSDIRNSGSNASFLSTGSPSDAVVEGNNIWDIQSGSYFANLIGWTGFKARRNTLYPLAGQAANAKGVRIASDSPYAVFEQNDFTAITNTLANKMNNLFVTAAGAAIIRNNPGLNPRNMGSTTGGVTSPSVPSSGINTTNITGYDCEVYVSCGAGVTVSAIKKGGNDGASTSGTATGLTIAANTIAFVGVVEAGQTIALTYGGGTPSWTWIGL